MNSAKKKRGLFASRAHSFKENFLDALKHGQVPTPHRKSRREKNAIVLAKKTSSTDNLTVTGHLGTAKTTDCLIKDVQFALKYFQDVVSKQTYEMLPGCATVVLETVLAIKVIKVVCHHSFLSLLHNTYNITFAIRLLVIFLIVLLNKS